MAAMLFRLLSRASAKKNANALRLEDLCTLFVKASIMDIMRAVLPCPSSP